MDEKLAIPTPEEVTEKPHLDIDATVIETGPIINEPYVLSVKSVLQSLISNAKLIIVICMVFFAVSAGIAFVYINRIRTNTGVASAMLVFRFPNAEEGLNPLGQPLNFNNNIRSPYIISKAIYESGLYNSGISADTIRSNLTVSAVNSAHVLESINLTREMAILVPERIQDLEHIVAHPTEHILQISRRGNLANLTDYEMVNLLNEIATQYIAYFTDAYSDVQFLDLQVGQFDHDAYDYFEIVSVLQNTTNNMLSFVGSQRDIAPHFRSASTQMTFGDIYAAITLMQNIELHRLDALITAHGISRNRIRTATMFEHQITLLEIDLAMARANADHALLLASKIYAPQEQCVYYENGSYENHRFTDVYETLMLIAMNYGREANSLDADLALYRRRVASLRPTGGQGASANAQFIENEIPALIESLDNWNNIITATTNDFINADAFHNSVRVLSPAVFYSSFAQYRQTFTFIILVGSLASLFLAVLFVLCKDILAEKPRYNK